MGVADLVNALVNRNTGADGENDDGDDKGPEIEFGAISERFFLSAGFFERARP